MYAPSLCQTRSPLGLSSKIFYAERDSPEAEEASGNVEPKQQLTPENNDCPTCNSWSSN